MLRDYLQLEEHTAEQLGEAALQVATSGPGRLILDWLQSRAFNTVATPGQEARHCGRQDLYLELMALIQAAQERRRHGGSVSVSSNGNG